MSAAWDGTRTRTRTIRGGERDAGGLDRELGAHLRGATSFFSAGAADATTRGARRGAVVARAGAPRLARFRTAADIVISRRTVRSRGRAGALRGVWGTRRGGAGSRETPRGSCPCRLCLCGRDDACDCGLRRDGEGPSLSSTYANRSVAPLRYGVHDGLSTLKKRSDTGRRRGLLLRPSSASGGAHLRTRRGARTNRKHGWTGLEPRCASSPRGSPSGPPPPPSARVRLPDLAGAVAAGGPGGRRRCRVTRAARRDLTPRASRAPTVPFPSVDLTRTPTFISHRSRTHQEEAHRRHERRAQVRGRGACNPSIASPSSLP